MAFRKLLFLFARVYWRIARPKTFGVKCVLVHPKDHHHVLLVRHSYGRREVWNLPGGGYSPRKETAHEAAAREIREELSLALVTLEVLGEYTTSAEGKRDTVALFFGRCNTDAFTMSEELAETRWVSIDNLDAVRPIARVALRGIQYYREMLAT